MSLHCPSVSLPRVSILKSNVTLKKPFSPISISYINPKSYSTLTTQCRAAKNHQKSSSSPSTSKKKKKNKNKKKNSAVEFDTSQIRGDKDYEILREFPVDADSHNVVSGFDSSLKYSDDDDMLVPRPPTGFFVDDDGVVSLTSNNRLVTIIDPENNLPLDCLIRRVFKSSEREECMLVCPIDTPVDIIKSTVNGWSVISDEEVESILPAAAFALAKIHMHLVHSGYCYTARGGFAYTEQDILEFQTDGGEDKRGVPTDGVEVTYFESEGTNYLIYTPSKPLQFVLVKGENGLFQMADDDILEDYAVIDAIDEETEFNALVVEEAAFIEAMLDECENLEEAGFVEAMLGDSENEY